LDLFSFQQIQRDFQYVALKATKGPFDSEPELPEFPFIDNFCIFEQMFNLAITEFDLENFFE
jgi:hypothetical protein